MLKCHTGYIKLGVTITCTHIMHIFIRLYYFSSKKQMRFIAVLFPYLAKVILNKIFLVEYFSCKKISNIDCMGDFQFDHSADLSDWFINALLKTDTIIYSIDLIS